jgi:hypothetical protein
LLPDWEIKEQDMLLFNKIRKSILDNPKLAFIFKPEFQLLAEGFYTPSRGEYLARMLPMFFSLKVKPVIVDKRLVLQIKGRGSLENLAEDAPFSGYFRPHFLKPASSILEIDCLDDNKNLKIISPQDGAFNLHLDKHQTAFNLVMFKDGELFANLRVELPAEQLLEVFKSNFPGSSKLS